MTEELEIERKDSELFQFREVGKVTIGQGVAITEAIQSQMLCVSNRYGICIVGKFDCFLFVTTDILVQAASQGKSLEESSCIFCNTR
jgi:hypothetical protein